MLNLAMLYLSNRDFLHNSPFKFCRITPLYRWRRHSRLSRSEKHATVKKYLQITSLYIPKRMIIKLSGYFHLIEFTLSESWWALLSLIYLFYHHLPRSLLEEYAFESIDMANTLKNESTNKSWILSMSSHWDTQGSNNEITALKLLNFIQRYITLLKKWKIKSF